MMSPKTVFATVQKLFFYLVYLCSENVINSNRLFYCSHPRWNKWKNNPNIYVSTNKANWAQLSEVWKRRFWWTDHCHISGKLIMSDSSRGKQTAEIYTCPVQDLIKFFTSSKTKELWHLFFKQNEFSVKKCFHVKAWPHRESDADADARCGQTLTHCNILLVKKHFSK